MKMRRLISLFIVMILMLSCLSGCEKGSSTSNNSSEAMGRYVEEEITYPEGYDDYLPLSMVKNEKGSIEIFAANTKEDNDFVKYTRLEDKTWEVTEQPWLNSMNTSDTTQIMDVILGADQKYYALLINVTLENTKVTSSIFQCVSEDADAVKLNIPALDAEYDIGGGYMVKPYITDMGVMKDGTIIAYDLYSGKTSSYAAGTGEDVGELEIGAPFIVSENSIIGTNTEGDALISMEEAGDTEIALDTSLASKGNVIENGGNITISDQAKYLVNNTGIARLENGGTLWQQMVDGELTTLSVPLVSYIDFIVMEGEKEEYYVLMQGLENVNFYHYYFDENIPSVPANEITVYSLNENSTIRQGIINYQKEHADVKVNYVVAIEEGSSATISDTIRALNTELLAGNGADILVLDGLPIDSFMEKGVLADIKEIVNPMIEDNTLIKNIAESFMKDEKMYAVPVRFQVPLVYGSEEVIDAMENMDSLTAYIDEHPDEAVFASMTYEALAKTFFLTNYNLLVDENEQMDKDNFLHFLDNLSILAENISASEDSDYMVSGGLEEGQVKLDNAAFLQDLYMKAGTVKAGIMQLRSIIDLVYPYGTITELGYKYRDINDLFIPGLTVGMNAASTKKEFATDFIKTLFSDDVQKALLGDGLPVNDRMLTEWTKQFNEVEDDSISFSTGQEVITIYYPKEEQTAEVFNYAKQLSTPLMYNKLLIDGIIEKIVDYLNGNSTAEQAAQDTINLINTYLSE